MNRPLVVGSAGVIVVGMMLGGLWAWWSGGRSAAPDESSLSSDTAPATFGSVFSLFALGRSGDGTQITRTSLLVPASVFVAGERVGLRIQTASGITKAVPVELRMVTTDTREETAVLKKYRKSFSVAPGLFSYCCITMPPAQGKYSLGVIMGNQYLSFIPFTVKARPAGSGLLAQ